MIDFLLYSSLIEVLIGCFYVAFMEQPWTRTKPAERVEEKIWADYELPR